MRIPHGMTPEEAMVHIGDVADTMLSQTLATVLVGGWGVLDLRAIADNEPYAQPCAAIARTVLLTQLARNIYETPIDFMADVPALVLSVRRSRIAWKP